MIQRCFSGDGWCFRVASSCVWNFSLFPLQLLTMTDAFCFVFFSWFNVIIIIIYISSTLFILFWGVRVSQRDSCFSWLCCGKRMASLSFASFQFSCQQEPLLTFRLWLLTRLLLLLLQQQQQQDSHERKKKNILLELCFYFRAISSIERYQTPYK